MSVALAQDQRRRRATSAGDSPILTVWASSADLSFKCLHLHSL